MAGNSNTTRGEGQGPQRSDLIERIKRIAAEEPERAYRAAGYSGQLTRAGRDLIGLCALHEERTASFKITVQGEHAGGWHCFGCDRGGTVLDFHLAHLGVAQLTHPLVLELAGRLGLEAEPRQWVEPEAIYDYQAADGAVLFQAVRFPNKRFAFRRPGPQEGEWIWDLRGVERVLYGLPRLKAHPDALVIPCEGEKDADLINKLALESGEADTVVAVTNPGGAVTGTSSSGKWLPQYTEALRDRDVVLPPDNDEAGRLHAENVATAIAATTRSVRVLTLPDLPEGGDVSDYLNQHSLYDLLSLALKAPLWEPQPADEGTAQSETTEESAPIPDPPKFVPCIELVQREIPQVPWLADGLLVRLGLGSFTADVGTLKTWAMLDAGISVATGEPIWGRFPVSEASVVVYLDEECGRAEISRRLSKLVMARGIDPNLPLFVCLYGGYLLDDADSLDALKRDLTSIGPTLVILDSLIRFHTQDENSARGMAVVSAALRSLSQDVGTAVISITHPRKLSMVSNEALERVRGSKEIPAGLDVCLFGRPLGDGTLVVETAKMRHGECPPPFALRLDEEPDGGMHITNLGDVDEVEDKITRAMESILSIMTDAGGTLDRPTIMTRCDGPQRTKSEALRRLVEDGRLEKAGKSGRRQLYRLPGQGLL